MSTIEISPGTHVTSALDEARALADEVGEPVSFDFNGVTLSVEPGDSPETAREKASAAFGRPVLTIEQEAVQAREDLERMKREQDAAIAEAGVMDEAAMRDAEVPWLDDADELAAYIESLVDRPHDYGTCVYAMSMAALAAFNHVAGRLGVTGFQASCADMDILRRNRRMEHGFRILDYGNLLYPQYWTPEHFPWAADLMDNPDVGPRIASAAREKLAAGQEHVAPNVRDHWRALAGRPYPEATP